MTKIIEMSKTDFMRLKLADRLMVQLHIGGKTWYVEGKVIRRDPDALRCKNGNYLAIDVGGTAIGFTGDNTCTVPSFGKLTMAVKEVRG